MRRTAGCGRAITAYRYRGKPAPTPDAHVWRRHRRATARDQQFEHDVFFGQHREHILVVGRPAEALLGDDVLADVQAGIHRQVQRALHGAPDQFILLALTLISA